VIGEVALELDEAPGALDLTLDGFVRRHQDLLVV
jgi:hypothetical protein